MLFGLWLVLQIQFQLLEVGFERCLNNQLVKWLNEEKVESSKPIIVDDDGGYCYLFRASVVWHCF